LISIINFGLILPVQELCRLFSGRADVDVMKASSSSLGEEIKVSSALVMACVGASSSDRASRERTIHGNYAKIAHDDKDAFNPKSGEQD